MSDVPPSRPTFTDRARNAARHLLDPLGAALVRRGVHPDTVTFIGLALVIVAAGAILFGQLQWAGLILLLALPLDALDGAVARALPDRGAFGAMLDSTADRYADGFIFGALSYHFAVQDQYDLLLLALLTLIGSLLVSYTRARAEGLNVNVTVGWFTRLERLVVTLVMLLVPPLLPWGVLLLASGTHLTAIQRLLYVYRALHSAGDKGDS